MTWPTQISPVDAARLAAERRVFEGHPPVVMLEVEAAPDSITTAEAEYWTQQARHWAQAVRKLPKSRLK
jgi:hypothetical protein